MYKFLVLKVSSLTPIYCVSSSFNIASARICDMNILITKKINTVNLASCRVIYRMLQVHYTFKFILDFCLVFYFNSIFIQILCMIYGQKQILFYWVLSRVKFIKRTFHSCYYWEYFVFSLKTNNKQFAIHICTSIIHWWTLTYII